MRAPAHILASRSTFWGTTDQIGCECPVRSMAAAQPAGYNERLRMRPSSTLGFLWDRNLAAYLGSRFCSGTAMTMLRAAIAWHVFALTNSAFHLGLIGLVQFVPALALTLLGGAVADTYARKRVIMLAQL